MLQALSIPLLSLICFHAVATDSQPAAIHKTGMVTIESFSSQHLHAKLKDRNSSDANTDCNVKFGLKLGVGLACLNFNKGYPNPDPPKDLAWKSSYLGGGVMEVKLHRRVYLQQEYQFMFLNGEAKGEGSNYTLSYLSLPVLLKYAPVPRFAFIAGPQVDLLLQAKEQYEGSSANVTHSTEERSFGAVVGVEYQPKYTFSLDLRYVAGINHIMIKQGTASKEFKLEMLQLSVILFPFK